MNTMMRSEEINSSSFVHLEELWNLSCSEPLPLLLSMELRLPCLILRKGPRVEADSGARRTLAAQTLGRVALRIGQTEATGALGRDTGLGKGLDNILT